MLSYFGKLSRKLRIDSGEILKEMANKLGVTSAYLSAVEMGKRNVPEDWPDKIVRIYDLTMEEMQDFKEAAYNSQLQLKVDLKDKSDIDKGLILAFARKLDDLDGLEKDKIMRILSKK